MSDLMPEEQKTLNALLEEALSALDLPRITAYVEKGADLSSETSMVENITTPAGGSTSRTVRAPLSHLILVAQTTFSDKVRQIADYISSQGVDIDSKNSQGNTPLAIHVQRGDTHFVRWLLDKKASLKTKCDGYIPIERAHRLPKDKACRKEIIDLILAKMPDVQAQFSGAAQKNDAADLATDEKIVAAPEKITIGPRKNGRADDQQGLRF